MTSTLPTRASLAAIVVTALAMTACGGSDHTTRPIDVTASPLMTFSGYQVPGQSDKFTADGRWYLTGDAGRVDGDFAATDEPNPPRRHGDRTPARRAAR